MDGLDGLLRDALLVTAIVSLPVLVLATLVGGLVAIVQAATQVQEQTLSLLPKILTVGAVVALFGRFGFGLLCQLFYEVVARIPHLIRG